MNELVRVARVSCDDYGKAREGVERVFDLLGPRESFGSSGDPLLVKPNLLFPKKPEKAVTTHFAVVDAVLSVAIDMGLTPVVGDSPGFGSARKVAQVSGIATICDRYNIPIIDLGESELSNPGGSTYKHIELARDAVDAGLIWNLPKWKTHTMMGLTLGVKNLYGCMPGRRKVKGHFRSGRNHDAFAAMLIDIYELLRPRLTILDGVIGMEGAGPGSGDPIALNLLMGSTCCHALDHEAARLSGFDPDELATTRLAIKNNLFDPDSVEVVGDLVEVMRLAPPPATPVDFKWPRWVKRVFRSSVTPPPTFSEDLCRQCDVCVEACPPKVLTSGKPPVLDEAGCIRCYCCQELCPHMAVEVKPTRLAKLLSIPFGGLRTIGRS